MPTVNLTLTGQALSKVDDTNVTLTLGGTPLTALLKATSITVGWTGQLSVARGGTGLGALGTANQLLRVNALGTALEYFTPSFGSGTVTGVLVASANGFTGTSDGNAATPTLTLTTSVSGLLKGNGTAISAAVAGTDYLTPTGSGAGLSGVVTTVNGASGAITNIGVTTNPLSQFAATTSAQLAGVISDETGSGALVFGTSPTITTSLNLSFATASTLVYSDASKNLVSLANGAANTYLKNDGSGNLSWATVASGISIGDTVGNSPVTGSALMAIGGVITQSISYRAQQATPFSTAFGYNSHISGSFSGVYNTAFGWEAGKATTTALGSTAIGAFALTAQTTASATGYNTAVGYQALASITTGYNNTGIGRDAGWAQTTAHECVFIGRRSGWSANGAWNTAVGNFSMLGSGGGSYVTALGAGTTNSGYSYAITLGAGATNSAANELMIGGEANGTIGSAGLGVTTVCIGNGNVNTSAASVSIRVTSGSGSNNAGGNLTKAAGKATGNGIGGDIRNQTSVKGASGTTLQTLGDRYSIIGKYVDLTAATATAFCRINIPTSTTAGGFVIATVEANDGVDYQARTFYVSYSAANKAGTTTVGLDVPHEIVAATSGTLTGTMTLVDSGSGNIDFKMDALSSLAETTLRISFQVFKNFGTGAVSAS